MNEIVNRQRKIKINKSELKEFADSAVGEISETNEKNVTISFISDRKMREINGEFRGTDQTTDVLSFPYEPEDFEIDSDIGSFTKGFLGDIIISAERAEKQAKENDLDCEIEIKQLILHGILHLCGYDHETDDGEMNRRELKLRDTLKI